MKWTPGWFIARFSHLEPSFNPVPNSSLHLKVGIQPNVTDSNLWSKPDISQKYIKLRLSPCEWSQREVANLTERKNLHTPVYCVKQCLSVCLPVMNFDLNHLQPGKIEWADIFGGISLPKRVVPNFFLLSRGPIWPGQGAKKPSFCPNMKFAKQISPLLNYYLS